MFCPLDQGKLQSHDEITSHILVAKDRRQPLVDKILDRAKAQVYGSVNALDKAVPNLNTEGKKLQIFIPFRLKNWDECSDDFSRTVGSVFTCNLLITPTATRRLYAKKILWQRFYANETASEQYNWNLTLL